MAKINRFTLLLLVLLSFTTLSGAQRTKSRGEPSESHDDLDDDQEGKAPLNQTSNDTTKLEDE